MPFTAEQVRQLSEASLIGFLDRRVAESTGLVDYKRDLSSQDRNSDRSNAELLKDISGFANAEGGHLIIGAAEPSRDGDGKSCLVGVDDGPQLATAIETRCADCIDPRIPGLLAHSVALLSGKAAIVVHVPPSPSRPHMVRYQKLRTFYIRHSETTQPMTSQEIRHSVLSAAAGEREAIDYTMRQESRLKQLHLAGRCAIFVHAMPLVPVEVLWNVTAAEWRSVMAGDQRRNRGGVTLSTGYPRIPSVEGVVSVNNDKAPSMIFEVHRNGFVSAMLVVAPNNGSSGPYFL